MNMKRNGNVWPYVIVGSAIGGAVGYLFMTESGKKIRHSVTHPDDMANNLEEARKFIERKARVVTDQVHNAIGKARRGIEEGERAYREAGQQYRARVVGQIENKSHEITSGVHHTVDKVSRTATTIEHDVLDPLVEIGAIVRGVERGIRTLLGKGGPVPISRGMMGS
jgi:gas vesicle protein